MIGFKSKTTLAAGAKHEMNKALGAASQLTTAPYDGVAGSVPDWMPQPLKIEFRDLRAVLLGCRECGEKHTPKQLQQWLKVYLQTGESQTITHARDIRDLEYIKSIADLGQEKGLNAYLGKGAATVYRKDAFTERQKTYGSQSREDGLTRAIVALLKEKPAERQAYQYVRDKLEAAAHTRVPIEGTNIEDIYEAKAEDEGAIEWSDDKTPATSAKLRGLKSRISRAAKKLKPV